MDKAAALTYRLTRGGYAAGVMSRFQSLGDNCEFGLVQRRWGVEQLGLFRFAGAFAPLIAGAIEDDFAELMDEANLNCYLSDQTREYIVHAPIYNIQFHTWIYGDAKPIELVGPEQKQKLRFLARNLREEMEEAGKIFVFRTRQPHERANVERLLRALRARGPNRLLWVEEAGPARAAGSVEDVGGGLLRGYMQRLAPYDDAFQAFDVGWLRLCERVLAITDRDSFREDCA